MKNFVGIITGCNSLAGIGRAPAYSITKKNPKVIYVMDIIDSNLSNLAEDIIDTTGVKCIPKRMDASSDEDTRSVIAEALKKYSRHDFYYASAATNIKYGVFAAIKYALAAMEQTSLQKPKSGGSIVATASSKIKKISSHTIC
ncbi:hypothetical protein MFLAVUS_006860 [Mucor flavus]|uniref:Uncharacterized protein n=1 Tax=Mucor flavus TaxID=439312 RepID=A0ABP9Z2P8_9FUNG